MPDPDAYRRLTRYLSGSCSAAESVEIERWLAADARRQHELDALRRLWEASAGIPPADRVDEMWRDLAAQIRASDAAEAPLATAPAPAASAQAAPRLALHHGAAPMPVRSRRWRIGLRIAASLALVFGYGAWRYRGVGAGPGADPAVAAAGLPGRVREYRTVRGQRGTVQLDDGTRVELGVASILRVHAFTRTRRDLELEGEGVFDVVHDPTRPFTVRSARAVIEDLGTRFGVRAYRDDPGVRVVVAKGSVMLRPGGAGSAAGVTLSPGDLGTIDQRGHPAVRHGVTAGAYLGWTSGHLFFDNATLAEVAADLERWYDIEIRIDERALAERRVTMSLPVSALADVLDAVVAPLGLTYTRRGSVVTLHGK